ncbi:MAG: NAD(+) synthase [Deltaproteobacteria bacterium]|nr:NAD(+) synthase [Deltaproteobacteria bacterium]
MFDKNVLKMDYATEADRITKAMKRIVTGVLKKRGVVVGVSGGIDSSTCLALAVRTFGPKRVCALLMPERDSSSTSGDLGQQLCEHLGVEYIVENIAPVLAAAGCYERRDEAIRQVFPEYDETYKQKIVVPPLEEGNRITFFSIVIQAPDGTMKKARLPLKAYLQVVAATNFKQRTRKMMDYYHADRLNYAVIGTPNRLEYDQGFFVKGGDGLADVKPIAHLYKTQVYDMAKYFELPEAVTSTTPTTDTYSLPQGQDEFYFALPYDKMDLMLHAFNHDVPTQEAAKALGLTEDQASWIYRDIETKRRSTRYLHLPPRLIDTVENVGSHRADD